MKKIHWILLGVLAVIVFWGVSGYNRFVRMQTAVDNQWAQVETQYQRRFDLIPNLVASTQGVLKQEQKVFGDLAQARTAYSGAKSVQEKVTAANGLESALSRLLVIVENYPQLRSSETVANLMTQLEGTENRISTERKRFNDAVATLNAATRVFPSSIIASLFNIEGRAYFESADGSEQAPKVEL